MSAARHPATGQFTTVAAGAHPVGRNPVEASIPRLDQQGAVPSMQGTEVTLTPLPRGADDLTDPRRLGVPVTVTHVDAATPANAGMVTQLRHPADPSAINMPEPHTAPTSALPVAPRVLEDWARRD
jgi:hypothetical protein